MKSDLWLAWRGWYARWYAMTEPFAIASGDAGWILDLGRSEVCTINRGGI